MTTIYDTSKFNKRVKFYKYVGSSDGAGGKIDDWKSKTGYEFIFARWANIIPLSGKFLYEAKMAQEEITHDIIVRFNKKIFNIRSGKLAIDYCGARLDVEYMIDVDNRHKFLKIRCVENYGKRKR